MQKRGQDFVTTTELLAINESVLKALKDHFDFLENARGGRIRVRKHSVTSILRTHTSSLTVITLCNSGTNEFGGKFSYHQRIFAPC